MAKKTCLLYMLSAMLIALAILCLGGCGGNADNKNVSRIVCGAITEPASLCPLLGTDSGSTEVQSLIYNALVYYDGTQKIQGDLAESWTVSADGKVYTFRLRDGVQWHDGVPLTADDVVFTFLLAQDPASGYLDARELANISRIEADGRDVVFRLDTPDSAFLARIAGIVILPQHIWQGVHDLREEAADITPIGTGAYKFVEWKKAQYIRLTANEAYHRGAPHIKTLFYKIVPDPNVMAMQLKRGEIDVCHIDPAMASVLAKDPAIKVTAGESRAYTYIALNHHKTAFADSRVRRAMMYGFARQNVIDNILSGGAYPAIAALPPSVLKSDLLPLGYDTEEAKRLLDEAGWHVGADGIRTCGGERLSLCLLVTNKNKRLGDSALAFRQNMREIGIEVDVVPMDFATLRSRHLLTGDYDACLISRRLPSDPLLMEEVWTSNGAGNLSGYSDPRIDALYRAAKDETDEKVRQAIFREIEEVLAGDAVQLFLWYPAVMIGMRSGIEGIDATHLGAKDNMFYNIERWTKVQ